MIASAAGPAFVAALPMYDWPEVRDAVDRFWAGWRDAIRARGVAAPERLDRSRPDAEIWRDPRLLVGQTCGGPFADGLSRTLRLLATPCYAAPGCEGPLYVSWIVAPRDRPDWRLEDIASARAAVNGQGSFSGWRALRRAAPEPREVLITGAHRLSARAVAEGAADVAALDAVAWALLQRHEPRTAERLRVVARTALAPGLPLVCSAERGEDEIAAIRAGLNRALAAPDLAEARAAMLLTGVESLPPDAYRPMSAAFDPADRAPSRR